jgi:hypothetical protein
MLISTLFIGIFLVYFYDTYTCLTFYNTLGDIDMLEKTIQKTFLLLFLLVITAAILVSLSQQVSAGDSVVPAKVLPQAASNRALMNFDEAIQASGLTLGGANPIKPLKSVEGMVLLANSEGDLVGQITDDARGATTLRLLGQEPQVISALK